MPHSPPHPGLRQHSATDGVAYPGLLGGNGKTDIARTQRVFQHIARAQISQPLPKPPKGAMPAGYTYLGQFLAHDMVFSTNIDHGVEAGLAPWSSTRPPLQLVTLFGQNSPAVCSFALDHIPASGAQVLGVALHQCGRHVRDSRNADHAIIDQLTALWQAAHNVLVRQYGQAARGLLTAIYHNIIRADYLRRLVPAAVWTHYFAQPKPRLLFDNAEQALRNFANAAFRGGHAQVRNSYQFNQNHRHNLSDVMAPIRHCPHSTRRQASWAIDWQMFFGPRAQPAARLGPKQSGMLSQLEANDPAIVELDLPLGAALGLGLPYLDLVRNVTGAVMPLPMVMARAAQADLADAPVLQAQMHGLLARWLRKHGAGLDAADRAALIAHPPPGFYYLLEADAAGGVSFGLLGGAVIAESFWWALQQATGPGLPTSLPAPLAQIVDMPGLIAWLAQQDLRSTGDTPC